MSFTITRGLAKLPSYPMLCKLAEQNAVQITGDERAGSFASGRVAGDYKFGPNCLLGTFAGHGVTGKFRFEISKVTVTIADKPFWLSEVLLKEKIDKGLDGLCSGLAHRPSS